MQTAEAVLNSSNCTFNSDDTSRDHKKIVGTQLSLDSGEVFYLGFEPVAKEDSNTLLDLSISVSQSSDALLKKELFFILFLFFRVIV